MKIARFAHGAHRGAGIVRGDSVVPAGERLLDPVPAGHPIP